ncbi:DNA binding domain-containing protein, excisionase family [Poseidonocella pacifica]|uniref:DNA binding domain-containing protein, excisionase family n=1 Tax=Poseidonocella pacifica TaxID=871651 RepID=A0A1I0XG79_9RHOB|nr:helix-turn-helix transcriptional regulator [Poseidonocella pacifica]SFA99310.1 DNA binding domain-containing protein, excisionase family [Poseidonocella pacifica]
MDPFAAEPEFFTVRELAEFLRVKERKVYDLAEKGSVPCTRATGKLLFPRRAIRAWIAASSDGVPGGMDRPNTFLGSHDPLLERALRDCRSGMATLFDSSLDGLRRFAAGEGIATGLHIYDAALDQWNIPFAKRYCADANAVLVGWAKRQRGLVFRKEAGDIRGMEDLIGKRVVRRQAEAGTEAIFEFHLQSSLVESESFESIGPVHSEQDAVLAVLQGRADVCFGLRSVSEPYGLGFSPVTVEHFDLLVDRAAWFDEPMQTFMQHCGTSSFKALATSAGGYDMAPLGVVRWNA